MDAGETEIRIPASDEGNEIYLRSLAYEVEKILLSEQSTWPELFRRLWFRASDQDFCEWDRGAIADKGRRQALLRAIYKVETIADPTPGASPMGYGPTFSPRWRRTRSLPISPAIGGN